VKLLEVASTTAQKVARPIVGAMKVAKKRKQGSFDADDERRLDPFHRDDNRRAEINARGRGGLDAWIPARVRTWFGEE